MTFVERKSRRPILVILCVMSAAGYLLFFCTDAAQALDCPRQDPAADTHGRLPEGIPDDFSISYVVTDSGEELELILAPQKRANEGITFELRMVRRKGGELEAEQSTVIDYDACCPIYDEVRGAFHLLDQEKVDEASSVARELESSRWLGRVPVPPFPPSGSWRISVTAAGETRSVKSDFTPFREINSIIDKIRSRLL